MKNYIRKNIEPLLIGFSIAYTFIRFMDLIGDVIVKIALIHAK